VEKVRQRGGKRKTYPDNGRGGRTGGGGKVIKAETNSVQRKKEFPLVWGMEGELHRGSGSPPVSRLTGNGVRERKVTEEDAESPREGERAPKKKKGGREKGKKDGEKLEKFKKRNRKIQIKTNWGK